MRLLSGFPKKLTMLQRHRIVFDISRIHVVFHVKWYDSSKRYILSAWLFSSLCKSSYYIYVTCLWVSRNLKAPATRRLVQQACFQATNKTPLWMSMNPEMNGAFTSEIFNNVESVSMSWRHHGYRPLPITLLLIDLEVDFVTQMIVVYHFVLFRRWACAWMAMWKVSVMYFVIKTM